MNNTTQRHGVGKTMNDYAQAVGTKFYQRCPKAVFAAIAVSAMTCGGDWLEKAELRLLHEWWVLYRNGIVPQMPPRDDPGEDV